MRSRTFAGAGFVKTIFLRKKRPISKDSFTALSDLYRSHIAMEEQEVFPVAQAELSAPAKQAIGRHMALRRGVPFTPEWAVPSHSEK